MKTMKNFIVLCLIILVDIHFSIAKLPTLYEYYAGDHIAAGLEENGTEFMLNKKPFVIYSGSFHYFRIVPEYWPLTLRKFKAAGLNTVQFYLPWNRHEPRPGHFDFDSYGLNLTYFLEEIHKADMFAIVRSGPYICAEWDLGGLPSWLLSDTQMKLRTLYPGYIESVRRYFREVFKILNRFQFSKNGGPIIALQIENELFGDVENLVKIDSNLKYLDELHKIIVDENDFHEFLFTSDPVEVAQSVIVKPLKYLLETANLNKNAYESLMKFKQNQPNRPVLVTEFWTGWFDSWGDSSHHRYSTLLFEQQISEILFQVNGSVNFYMFIGGTNFGFYNGARITTSYDYDAQLSESGNYTEKYYKTLELYEKLLKTGRLPPVALPEIPKIDKAKSYGKLNMNQYIDLEQILQQLKPIQAKRPIFMEFLRKSSGFGFILYRLKTKPISTLNITGPISDRAIVMINGNMVAKIDDGAKFLNLDLKRSEWFKSSNTNDEFTIDILVENLGRANYFISLMNKQHKGINSTILLDGKASDSVEMFTFDLNDDFMKNSINAKTMDWKNSENHNNKLKGPKLYRAFLRIDQNPQDTFMKLEKWTYGNVFINNFNIGRFDHRGPQKTLYVPGPLLQKGMNIINILDLDHQDDNTIIEFVDYPILE